MANLRTRIMLDNGAGTTHVEVVRAKRRKAQRRYETHKMTKASAKRFRRVIQLPVWETSIEFDDDELSHTVYLHASTFVGTPPVAFIDLRRDASDQLESLSEDQLRALKKQWYVRACNEGVISTCREIARQLGGDINHNYGPKYTWAQDGVDVYVDDYGKYMTVSYKGRRVCSTHPCDNLFVPGEWVLVIDQYAQAAKDKSNAKEARRVEERRQQLLGSLRG